ncbi:MAG: OmpA family protein [Bacteroidia bacterium]|nr:OmpA family protein [Bacteroidia bacterium]MBT8279587.1 OmpA family protein [Bacteroidia bacterium]NND25287.1 OmpA family protein [Flavobacteriaceae bacterium]NNL34008.1 OmpA family protein [Flavobacteriaceae bacterium]RZW56089.1 MAG: OmpA family protein [Flavobacteriaceae bacterium]
MKQVLFFVCLCIGFNFATGQNLPDNPDPGKCYVKCITKDEFTDVSETVQVYPAYTALEVSPATYRTVTEEVLVKEASKKYKYVPATYETVDVSYTSKEGRTDLAVIPASFGSDSRTYEIAPKSSGWEYKQLEECNSPNKEDCVAACFVEYPAQFGNITYSTLLTDASTSSVSISGETSTYKKRVVKTPARMEEIVIPAEYATITRQVLDKPASTSSTTVPARSETITKTVLAKKGGITSWEEIECELLNATPLPIFYETASARLTAASKKVIDERLLPILNDKPVNIEIMSHTDSRGNDSYNMSLSQQRANAVVNYLVSKGVSRSRLSSKGYGETRLVNRCSNGVECSPTDHQRNRRTEFRVLNN